MDERLRYLERTNGFFTRSEVRDCGYDDRAVAAALRSREWYRVRNGAYCYWDTWHGLPEEARHLVLAKAVMRSMPGRVVLSHGTSLIGQHVDVWGMDLKRVHVTRIDGGAGRIEGDVHHHEGVVREGDVVERDGLLMTEPTRAVLEHACCSPIPSGLVSANSALHMEIVIPDALQMLMDNGFERWCGSRKVRVVVLLSDGRIESVGESLSFHLFWTQGLPMPELQFHVYDADGQLLGIVDFAWLEHKVFGEFDGKIKYGRLLKDGEDPGEAVFKEKRREDLIREATGCSMGRLIWPDIFRPVVTGNRFRRLLHLAA